MHRVAGPAAAAALRTVPPSLRALATAARPVHNTATHVPQRRFASTSEQFKKWKEQIRQNAAETQAASQWVKEHGSPYSVLGLKENAPKEEVRAAYKRLSLVKHPDKGGSLEEFQKIQFAQQIILNGTYTEGGADPGKMGAGAYRLTIPALLLLVVAASSALYVVVWMPVRWALRKMGVLSIPAPPEPTEEFKLRDEVRTLQAAVDKLQDTLDEIQRELERSKYPRRKMAKSA